MKKSILTLAVILLAGFVSAHTGQDSYDHHDGMMGYWGTGMFQMGILSWIIAMLVVTVLILLIVWLVKQLQKPNRRRR